VVDELGLGSTKRESEFWIILKSDDVLVMKYVCMLADWDKALIV
jgi:hypothetical protein